jgi:hypothetical protein
LSISRTLVRRHLEGRKFIMRFLMFYSPDPKRVQQRPKQEEMEVMGKFIEESFKSGELIATGGLLPPSVCSGRIESKDGDVIVKDGPFSESKEVIGGYAIIRAASKAAAIEMTKRFLKVAGDGVCEYRQIADESPDNT